MALSVFKRSRDQWKDVISRQNNKRKALEEFISEFKSPAKKWTKNPDQEDEAMISFKSKSPAKYQTPSRTTTADGDRIRTDSASSLVNFVIDKRGDANLRQKLVSQPDQQPVPDSDQPVEKKKKDKKKKVKSYLDDL